MKKTFKRLSPSSHSVKTHKHLRWFGTYLHINSLWAFNRHTLSRAFAVGLFCAFIPIPFQMILAALGAIIFASNLPVAVALVWISNPLTIPPIFYACYLIGNWVLNITVEKDFIFSLEYLWNILPQIWQPFLLGCLIVASISALLGYWLVRFAFLVHLSQYKNKKRRKNL